MGTKTLHLKSAALGRVKIEGNLIVSPSNGVQLVSVRFQEDTDDRSSDEFPAWNAYPAGSWNFALDVDERDLLQQVEVEHRPRPIAGRRQKMHRSACAFLCDRGRRDAP